MRLLLTGFGRHRVTVAEMPGPPTEDADEPQQTDHLTIRTRRLELVPTSAALMRAVLERDWAEAGRLAGAVWPDEWRDGWPWLRRYLDETEREPGAAAWGPRLVFRVDSVRVLVAEAGFHGPPDADGAVEFGYMVLAAHRRQGVAEEGARGLLTWAAGRVGARHVAAVVDPGNAASLRLLAKLNFEPVGPVDQDGREGQLLLRRALGR